MKKILVAFLVFLFVPVAYGFSDVNEDSEHYDAITFLEERGIVSGYPDGSFGVDDEVNRVEALYMILQSSVSYRTASIEFPYADFWDIDTDAWYYDSLAEAVSYGIAAGNPDGSFDPGRFVNKVEFLKMLLLAFEIDVSAHEGDEWYSGYLGYARTVGLVYPNMENDLEPSVYLTRGDCAEILYKMIVIDEGGDLQKLLSMVEAYLVQVLVDLNLDDINSALEDSANAVFYSEMALDIDSDEGLVNAVNKIALGFQELCLAYQAGLDGDPDSAAEHVENAKQYATDAYYDDTSTQSLGAQIKEFGDELLDNL